MYGELSVEERARILAADKRPRRQPTGLCLACMSKTCKHLTLAPRLTTMECQLVRTMQQGHSNKELAHICGISEGSVKVYVSRILHKLNVDNRTQVVIWAFLHQDLLEEKQP